MKQDCLNLVILLSNSQADTTLMSGYYDDVVSRLGVQDWHTVATPITFTSKQSTFSLPSGLLNLLQLIYDTDVLSLLSLREMESLKAAWRNSYGRPIAFTLDAEPAKGGEVFPVPNQAAQQIIPVHGLPTGLDYQPGNGIAIYSQQVTDVLPYLNLPVALKILYREYSRESNHTDYNFANFANMLANAIFEALLTDGTATVHESA